MLKHRGFFFLSHPRSTSSIRSPQVLALAAFGNLKGALADSGRNHEYLAQQVLGSYYRSNSTLSARVLHQSASSVPCCMHLVLPLMRSAKHCHATAINVNSSTTCEPKLEVRRYLSQQRTYSEYYSWFGSRTLVIVSYWSEMFRNVFWMTGLLNPKSSGKKKIIRHFLFA